MDKIWLPLDIRQLRNRIGAFGVVIMRVDVRDSLAQWFDEKPWRFKLILLLHTALDLGTKGDTAMLTNSKLALSVALVLATASAAVRLPSTQFVIRRRPCSKWLQAPT